MFIKQQGAPYPHDYKRHGTTTLFAALNVLDGRVSGECMAKHRHQEFLRFLRRVTGSLLAAPCCT